jgi:hypothetical protein
MSGFQRLFTCALCQRDVHDFWTRNGRDRQLPPICSGCERYYGDRKPTDGAFMDRRLAQRLSAIANVLSGEAHSKQWMMQHGRA